MNELHLPFLELGILITLVGAVVVSRLADPFRARRLTLIFSGLALITSIAAWQDFIFLHVQHANDRWHLVTHLLGRELFSIDQLSAPLLPLIALLYFLTSLATLPTKIRRFAFGATLVSESLVLATVSCREPWLIIALLAVSTIGPYLELRSRGHSTRVYTLHMGLFVALLVIGWWFVQSEGAGRVHSLWAIIPLLGAVLIRSGIAPFHCWMTDLFEHATFGKALLFVTPQIGAYAAVRLVLPIAPDWVLRSIGLTSLFTAVYAASMALVQRDARRFFCYLFLSHSALVLVGLEIVTPLGLTGGLSVWLSASIALGGLGLTLRSLEARRGRVSLSDYQGLYEHTPHLAMFFVLTGLASVGFPGTLGFVGTELLIDGVVATYPFVGIAVVLAAALNGIAIVRGYFLLFAGTRKIASVSLMIRNRERLAVLTLSMLILAGGLIPQPGIVSRHIAAEELLRQRADISGAPPVTKPANTHASTAH